VARSQESWPIRRSSSRLIHNLNLATRVGADASDQLKYLAERIPATFIYAGINVEGAGCSPETAASRSPAGSA
jgi:hypothetical protein